MTALQAEIAQMERSLQEAGISVNQVCREANVDRSSWSRWKAGQSEPTVSRWDAVRTVVARLLNGTPAGTDAADAAGQQAPEAA